MTNNLSIIYTRHLKYHMNESGYLFITHTVQKAMLSAGADDNDFGGMQKSLFVIWKTNLL